jgi:IclR family transcriptional regulator, KDG regulon repressor
LATPISDRKTIDKAMQVLTAFTHERPELAVTELAQRLGMHKSVISRLASSLRSWGMLEQNPTTGRLRIGPAAFRIGTLFSQRNSLAEMAMPLLADLVYHTGQSVHLSVLDGLKILVIATVESPNSLRVIMRVGDQRHLHTTAAGKLFMAMGSPELMDAAYQATGFEAMTPDTITSREQMQRGFARIRRERVATNRGENTAGAGAVAAPVTSRTGEVVAVVSTVFPMNVVDATALASIENRTKECADQLSRRFFQILKLNIQMTKEK